MLASIQISLLGVALATFIWTTEYQDGGLFNDFIEVKKSEDGKSDVLVFRQLSPTLVMEIINNNVYQKARKSYPILEFLPASLGGGDVGVKEAKAGPGKTSVIASLLIFSCVLAFLLYLCVVVLTFESGCMGCCRKCLQSRKSMSTTAMEENRSKPLNSQSSLLERVHRQTLKSIDRTPKTRYGFRIYHILVGITCGLLLLGLLVSTCVNIYAGALVTDFTEPGTPGTDASIIASTRTAQSSDVGTDEFTIVKALYRVFGDIVAFLEIGLETGIQLTKLFATKLTDFLNQTLTGGVNTTFDKLMLAYGVKVLLDDGAKLQEDIQSLQINMDIIRSKNKIVSATLSSFTGSLKVLYDLIKVELNEICAKDIGVSLNKQCQMLQNDVNLLVIKFNSAVFETEPATILNFLLTQLGININLILEQLNKIPQQLNLLQQDIIKKVQELLNLDKILEPLDKLWEVVRNKTIDVKTSLDSVGKDMTTLMASNQTPIKLTVYFPAAIIAVFLCVGIVLMVLYTVEVLEHGLCILPSSVTEPRQADLRMSFGVCNNCGFFSYAIILSILSLILSTLVILVMPITAVIASKGCVYADTENGIAKTDYLVNNFIAKLWPPLINDITASLGNSEVVEFLNFTAPENVFRAITISCRPAKTAANRLSAKAGLLNAVGWTSLVDVDKLVKSDLIKGQLEKGYTLILEQIKNMDIASLIPNDLEKTTALVRNITIYFDSIDYTDSIKQLDSNNFPITRLKTFAEELNLFGEKLQLLGQSQGGVLKKLSSSLNQQLVNSKPGLEEAQQLKIAFEEVQKRRELTKFIDKLLSNVENVRVIVSNEATLLAPIKPIYAEFSVSLMKNIRIYLTVEVAAFTLALLPCNDLYQSVNTAISIVCRQEGMLTRLFAWGYSLALCILFELLFFISLFHLAFVQSQQFQRLYQSKPSNPNLSLATTNLNVPDKQREQNLHPPIKKNNYSSDEFHFGPADRVLNTRRTKSEESISIIFNPKSIHNQPANDLASFIISEFEPFTSDRIEIIPEENYVQSSSSGYNTKSDQLSPVSSTVRRHFQMSPNIVQNKPHFSSQFKAFVPNNQPPIPKPRGPQRLFPQTQFPLAAHFPLKTKKNENESEPSEPTSSSFKQIQ